MKRHNSFTLVELLIAVSIFSVIALCLYSVFSGGIRIWRKQEDGFRYVHAARLALDRMAKDLHNAINYSTPKETLTGAGGIQDLKFIGDKNKISFITVIGVAIARVNYIFEEGSGNEGSLKRRIALQREGFKEEDKKEETLITGLKGLSFEYAYASADKDALVDWRDSWLGEDKEAKAKMPKGVRIALVFGRSGMNKDEIFKKTVFIPMAISEK